jgi:hypothetical protein
VLGAALEEADALAHHFPPLGHELLPQRDDAIAHPVELDLLAGVGEPAVQEQRAGRGRGDEAGEEVRGEEHVGIHHQRAVPREGVARAPQRQDGALLVFGVLDEADPHVAAPRSRPRAHLILAMADHDHCLVHAGGGEGAEHPVQQMPPGDGQETLVRVIGERREPARHPRREDDGLHRPRPAAACPRPRSAPRNRSRISSGG